MLKIQNAVFFILFILVFPFCAEAELITLKSGKVLEGKVVEKTADYIKVKYNGLDVYYENKYVKSVTADKTQEPEEAGSEGKPHEEEFLPGDGMDLGAKGDFSGARGKFEKQLGDIRIGLSILDAVDKGSMGREEAVYLFQGLSAMMRKEYRQALVPLEKAWEIDPKDPDLNYNLAFAHFSLGEYEKSVAYLSVIIKYNPLDAEAYELIAKDYCNLGDYSKAKDSLAEARDLLKKNGNTEDLAKIEELLGIVTEAAP
ncbi:MAG: tetratricopeptide repeat protein [Candidatus Omnitrophica bacterium]|jgi:tetratricopeptide (TPR) repeat protein|nr:tetratricopeptide repeat protein [Candidatus Omnitrophota bacterium]MDD5077582.1 tetratricopeptide repeat protein [Candidatus Omnitrophota bacterium]